MSLNFTNIKKQAEQLKTSEQVALEKEQAIIVSATKHKEAVKGLFTDLFFSQPITNGNGGRDVKASFENDLNIVLTILPAELTGRGIIEPTDKKANFVLSKKLKDKLLAQYMLNDITDYQKDNLTQQDYQYQYKHGGEVKTCGFDDLKSIIQNLLDA